MRQIARILVLAVLVSSLAAPSASAAEKPKVAKPAKEQTYLTYTLKDVIVSSYSL